MSVIKFILISLVLNVSLAQISTVNNFQETSNLSNQQEVNANATVTLISSDDIVSRNGRGFVYRRNDLRSYGFCPDQPLVDQPVLGFCSGVLISENVILTAGHCIENASDCSSTRFVFDFENKILQTPAGPIPQPPSLLPEENIFSCSKIHFQSYDFTDDVALVKLDRNVNGRTPVRYRRSGEPKENDKVYLISSPRGLPTKISEGVVTFSLAGEMRSSLSSNYASAVGSSGGPVFNSETHLLEAIHRGTNLTNLNQKEFGPSGCRLWPDINHLVESTDLSGAPLIYSGRANTNPVFNYLDKLDRFTSSKMTSGSRNNPRNSLQFDKAVE